MERKSRQLDGTATTCKDNSMYSKIYHLHINSIGIGMQYLKLKYYIKVLSNTILKHVNTTPWHRISLLCRAQGYTYTCTCTCITKSCLLVRNIHVLSYCCHTNLISVVHSHGYATSVLEVKNLHSILSTSFWCVYHLYLTISCQQKILAFKTIINCHILLYVMKHKKKRVTCISEMNNH